MPSAPRNERRKAAIAAEVLPTLASNIRRARAAADRMSQENLARDADLDRTYVGKIERCEINPSVVNLTAIARVLHTTPAELLRGIE